MISATYTKQECELVYNGCQLRCARRWTIVNLAKPMKLLLRLYQTNYETCSSDAAATSLCSAEIPED